MCVMGHLDPPLCFLIPLGPESLHLRNILSHLPLIELRRTILHPSPHVLDTLFQQVRNIYHTKKVCPMSSLNVVPQALHFLYQLVLDLGPDSLNTGLWKADQRKVSLRLSRRKVR